LALVPAQHDINVLTVVPLGPVAGIGLNVLAIVQDPDQGPLNTEVINPVTTTVAAVLVIPGRTVLALRQGRIRKTLIIGSEDDGRKRSGTRGMAGIKRVGRRGRLGRRRSERRRRKRR
jgi:hypothetical protein